MMRLPSVHPVRVFRPGHVVGREPERFEESEDGAYYVGRMSDRSESGFPEELSVGSGRHAVRLLRRRDRWAVLGELPRHLAAAVVCRMDDEASVLEGSPPTQPAELAGRIAPVYAVEGSESYAVPTGLVSVRTTEGRKIEELSAAIEAAGYRIQESPSYARHTAWLAVRNGSLPDALDGLERLRATEGVILVEPQLLRESRRKGS